METDKKYILVTGGAGYIGSHTVVALIEKGFTPVIIDDFRNSNKDVIQRLQTITKQEIVYFNIACQDQSRLRGVLEQFPASGVIHFAARSEEHTSELQSRPHLVCRLLLEKKKKKQI